MLGGFIRFILETCLAKGLLLFPFLKFKLSSRTTKWGVTLRAIERLASNRGWVLDHHFVSWYVFFIHVIFDVGFWLIHSYDFGFCDNTIGSCISFVNIRKKIGWKCIHCYWKILHCDAKCALHVGVAHQGRLHPSFKVCLRMNSIIPFRDADLFFWMFDFHFSQFLGEGCQIDFHHILFIFPILVMSQGLVYPLCSR